MSLSVKALYPLVRSWVAYAALPAAGIVTAPILAHALGPEGRGQLAGMLQPLTLAGAVASLGVPSAVTFFVARGFSASSVIRHAVRLSLVMCSLVAVALIMYSSRVAGRLDVSLVAMLVIWAFFIPGVFISVHRAHVQAFRGYASIDLERFLSAVIRVGIVTLLWMTGVGSVLAFACGYVLPGIVAALALRTPRRLEIQYSRDDRVASSREFVTYAVSASFGTIAAAMSARLDQAIMPAIVPPAELGFYSIAVAIAEISTIITQVISRNILAEVSGGVANKVIIRSIIVGGLAQAALSAIIAVVLPYVMPVLFGREFIPAILCVRILLVSSFVAYWGSVGTVYLSGLGRPGLSSLGQAVAALITILAFWMAWSRMSADVAAWISVWSQVGALVTVLSLGVFMTSPAMKLSHKFVEKE